MSTDGFYWKKGSNQKLVKGILKKIEGLENSGNGDLTLLAFKKLNSLLSKSELKIIKRVLEINPRKYDFKGDRLGIQSIPNNLTRINDQHYIFKRKKHDISTQYLLKQVLKNYQALNKSLAKDIGKKLLVGSAYRSPAYQVITFFHYLNVYDFDFEKTMKRVAMPAFSEHCSLSRPAIDFITKNGLPSDKHPLNFARSPEYRWLRKNANQFGFEESYPKNNTVGIMFEPWHWRLITN